MSEKPPLKKPDQSLQDWLEQFGSESDEEIARRLLLGETKVEQIENEPDSTSGDDGEPEKAESEYERRFRRGAGLKPLDENPVDQPIQTPTEDNSRRKTRTAAPGYPSQAGAIADEPVDDHPTGSGNLDFEQIEKRLAGESTPGEDVPSLLEAGKRHRKRAGTGTVPPFDPEDIERLETPNRPQAIPPFYESKRKVVTDEQQLRQIGLQGYQPPAGSDSSPVLPASKWDWFTQMAGFKKILLIAGAVLAAASILFLAIWALEPGAPPPTSSLDASIPIPSGVVLPDGQLFELAIGGFEDEKWSPQGAEWLVDTQVPRWLSLPWSNILEESCRGFQVNDVIQLHMSNGDILIFRFMGLEELSLDEIGAFHANTADLLILLTKGVGSRHPVVIASP
ncbi:MAG: hypothetical protein FJZ96_02080 [Chloroflexi bacterium]|nr:hypothetical protein [Chloroflexota bacterium]